MVLLITEAAVNTFFLTTPFILSTIQLFTWVELGYDNNETRTSGTRDRKYILQVWLVQIYSAVPHLKPERHSGMLKPKTKHPLS